MRGRKYAIYVSRKVYEWIMENYYDYKDKYGFKSLDEFLESCVNAFLTMDIEYRDRSDSKSLSELLVRSQLEYR